MIEEIFDLSEVSDIVEACGLDPLPPLETGVFHCYSDKYRQGFAFISVIADEAELIDIAVRRELRGKGLGEKLLCYALEQAKSNAASSMYLEVRKSNEAAKMLYQKYGFEIIGERRKYYSDGEDAVLMRKLIYD